MSNQPSLPYDEVVKKFLTGAKRGTESTVARWIDQVKDDPSTMLLAWDHITGRIFSKQEGYEALEVLVKNGMDPNTRVSAVYPTTTALMIVAGSEWRHNPYTITSAGKTLIDHGANVNVSDRVGSVLTKASREGHADLVKTLIAAGAKTDFPGMYQANPLHSAVAHDRFNVVDILLAAGANPNAKNSEGETALFYSKSVATAKSLLDAGTDPECVSSTRGVTAYQQQWEHGQYVLPDDVRALIRQSKLTTVASQARPDDLASPEEALSRRSRGRFM